MLGQRSINVQNLLQNPERITCSAPICWKPGSNDHEAVSTDSHTHYGRVGYNPDGICGLRRELHNKVGEHCGEVR